MKAILTAALLLATALIAAPGASAECYDDPTGTFEYACIDDYEYSYGDCAGGADGYDYHYSEIWLYDRDRPRTYADIGTYDYCNRDSRWGYENEGSGEYVYVWREDVADVYVDRYQGSYSSGSYAYDSSGEYVGLYIEATDTWAEVGHYERTGSYERCSIYVYHDIGGTWTYEEIPC